MSNVFASSLGAQRCCRRQTPVAEILGELRAAREKLVRKLDALKAEDVGISALHPRLQKPMRVIDWVYFVAEHNDHHLATARRAILSVSKRAITDREETS